jgi:hypothetical protein
MPLRYDGLLWLLLLLGPLFFLQRSLQREMQAIFLFLTRRVDVSLALFSLLFLPGVVLHEGSHWLMARLLGVRTGRFSVVPRTLGNGRLQLGYVETAAVDPLRDALIGAAPLLLGGAFVAYAGLKQLGLLTLWESAVLAGPNAVLDALPALFNRPDFWLWFYLVFAVSGTMLPSPSDRRAWLPVALLAGLLVGVSVLAGAGPWLMQNLAGPFNQALRAAAVVFGICVFIHLVLLPPLWLARKLLGRLTGLQVVG